MTRRVYVASSWRNDLQPLIVLTLREAGHQVYDFRNPTVGYDNPNGLAHGFQWSSIDPHWESWAPDAYRDALTHPLSEQGFLSDWGAMQWADTGVLVLPSGRSAHLEAGYFSGAGKALYILMQERQEPELMYRMASGICLSVREMIERLSEDRLVAGTVAS
jgi:hypothetical protein